MDQTERSGNNVEDTVDDEEDQCGADIFAIEFEKWREECFGLATEEQLERIEGEH